MKEILSLSTNVLPGRDFRKWIKAMPLVVNNTLKAGRRARKKRLLEVRCCWHQQTQWFNGDSGSDKQEFKTTTLLDIWTHWNMMNTVHFVNFISFHLNLVVVARYWTFLYAFHRHICETCLRNTTQKNLSTYEINITARKMLYSLIETYQKTQLMNKNHMLASSMK